MPNSKKMIRLFVFVILLFLCGVVCVCVCVCVGVGVCGWVCLLVGLGFCRFLFFACVHAHIFVCLSVSQSVCLPVFLSVICLLSQSLYTKWNHQKVSEKITSCANAAQWKEHTNTVQSRKPLYWSQWSVSLTSRPTQVLLLAIFYQRSLIVSLDICCPL
jgi:hypothetical protein